MILILLFLKKNQFENEKNLKNINSKKWNIKSEKNNGIFEVYELIIQK